MKFKRTGFVYVSALFLSTALFIVACAPMHKSVDFNSASELVWPAKPERSRIAYVTSFYHPEHFGIEKGFFSWLGELFTGEEERRMIRPMAVTQTSDNILFVADPGVKGIHRYNIKEKSYSLIRLKNDEVLPSPVGLAVDGDDNVYVVDSELAQLFKIEKNKDVAISVTLNEALSQPTSVAIDSDTNSLYITDTASHQIKHFSFAGKLISKIGKRGKAKGEFNFPTMIWRDKLGQLFVTDSLNFRIQIFNREGKFIRYFGRQGSGTGFLSRPKGVATDSKGHVYVVDTLFHVFQLFNEKGKFLLHVGEQGQGKGEFWLPSGIFISNNDMIYVADSHNRRVQVFRYLGGQS